MPALGQHGGLLFAANPIGAAAVIINGGPTTYTMPTANNGWSARFYPYDSRDIKKIHLSFSAVSSPGTITARIETNDATTGKPSGSLYDAAATKQFTPSAGLNTITFDSLPTAGMTAGNGYHLVLIKDDTGTTCTLNARLSPAAYPCEVLTATDGSTRSNFAEVANNGPICFFTLEDDAIESFGCIGTVAVDNTTYPVYGSDRVAACKIVLPVGVVARGIMLPNGFIRVGTPAGNLRIRLLDGSNNAVSGTTRTLDKDDLTGSNTRVVFCNFDGLVTLAAGTYRLAFDSASSADSSNCWRINAATFLDAALVPTGFQMSISTNASTSFTWSDSTLNAALGGLIIDSFSAGGGGGVLIGPGRLVRN